MLTEITPPYVRAALDEFSFIIDETSHHSSGPSCPKKDRRSPLTGGRAQGIKGLFGSITRKPGATKEEPQSSQGKVEFRMRVPQIMNLPLRLP